MSKKALYLLTSSFPFGAKEPVVQQEVETLSKYFDKIIIICSTPSDNITVDLPQNCEAEYFSSSTNLFQKTFFAFSLIFTSLFWSELKVINESYNLSYTILIFKTLFSSYAEAMMFKKQIARLKRKHNLQHYENYYYAWWAKYQSIGFAMLMKKKAFSKFFIRMHGFDLYFERHPSNYLPFRSFIFQQATNVLFISEQGKKYIENKFKKSYKKHLVCRLGTNNDKIPINYKEDKSLKIVSCSNLIPLKRVHLIIKALELLSSEINLNWKHFGDGELYEDLTMLANEKLAPKSNIKYSFEGFLNNEKVLEYFSQNQIDLFINMSETEGIPISIMEANSCGIPAIATDVGGVSEIVSSKTGYLVPANVEPSEIAEIINDYFKMSLDEKLLIRSSAFNKWQKDYNSSSNISFLKDIFFQTESESL